MLNMKCSHCGAEIAGRYFSDYWGNSYCAAHYRDVPQCAYCGRLISPKLTKGGKTYSDGRRICGLCLPSAVNDADTGLSLLQEVHDQLADEGIIIKPFKPEFLLISRSKLRQLDKSSGEKQGFAVFNRKMVNGKISEFKMQIYILQGLPEMSFISTCAHELMHIWFYSHNLTDIRPLLLEGSCNMAAYLVLKKQLTPEAEFLIKGLFEDKDKVYGTGFRKVQKLTSRLGTVGWLDYLKTHKRI